MCLYTNQTMPDPPILEFLPRSDGCPRTAGVLRRSAAEQQCVNASNGQRLYYLFALVRILLLLASAALVIAATAAVLHV